MSAPLTIVVVDDHPLFRNGVKALLATVPEVEVVAEGTNGVEAFELVEQLRPDLLLIDLQMPGGDGLTAIRRIAASVPATRILVVTMFEDDDSVFAALRTGAHGYVLKDMDGDELVRSILAVGRGWATYSPAIAARIAKFFAALPTQVADVFPELSDSERNVLRLMARGLTNDAIAAQLSLSPKTIRNYVSAIFSKLHVADRAQAVVRARDAGLH